MTFLSLFLSIALSWFLPQTFTIVGSVRAADGRAVAGVRVSVLDENFQPIRNLFIDSSGRFTIRGLSSGRYTLRVETTGTPYEELAQRVELQALRVRGGTEVFPVDLVLKPKRVKENPPRAGTVFAQEIPPAARAQYERGVNSLKERKTEAGVAELAKAIALFPDYFDALELLGTEYVRSGQYEPAVPVLTHAVEVNTRAPKSLYALGVAHLKLNRPAEAVAWLEKSSALDPESVNTQMMLGLAYGNNQALAESEAAFKRALLLGEATAAEAHFYLAGIYNKQERYREAWGELELYLKESKDIKDPAQVKAMIEKLKAKERARK